MISAEVIDYISELLIGKISELSQCTLPEDGLSSGGRSVLRCTRERSVRLISYTDDPEEIARAWVVIRPSGFFDTGRYGTPLAEPQLPLEIWEGIPLLYGSPQHEWINGGRTLLLHADLIASVFFLISRYEEMYQRGERDELGRFPASAALPVRADFLHRPIIDEYGAALRQLIIQGGIADKAGIQLEARPQFFSKINLTHNLNRPYQYRGWTDLGKAFRSGIWNPIRLFRKCFGRAEADDFYTYPKFLQWNNQLKQNTPKGLVDTLFFVRRPTHHTLDRPHYRLRSRYMRRVQLIAHKYGVQYGLLCSYEASENPQRIDRELHQLEERLQGQSINRSRHHMLAVREPEDMVELLGAGIRHDYSMGYATHAGFRLGTCRPVRLINPNTRRLTDLVMHPLTLSDHSLTSPEGMGLDYDEALTYATKLIDATARYAGELNILWHNDSFCGKAGELNTPLYRALLRHIYHIEQDDEREEDEETKALRSVLNRHGCTEIKTAP